MTESNKWDELVIRVILADKDLKIHEVRDLLSIKSLLFDQAEYPSIVALIKQSDWIGIAALGQNQEKKDGFGEYLDIIRFSSREGRNYVVTIYDSDGLWQDPEIIEIFPLSYGIFF